MAESFNNCQGQLSPMQDQVPLVNGEEVGSSYGQQSATSLGISNTSPEQSSANNTTGQQAGFNALHRKSKDSITGDGTQTTQLPRGPTVNRSCSRTILIIGKAGVGKETIAAQILNQGQSKASGSSIAGITRRSRALREFEGVNNENISCKIKIVDISAQYDKNPQGNYRSDIRSACMEPLNLILFVVQRGRITKVERDVFSSIVQKCPPKITSLVISYCEDLDESGRDEIIKDFKEDSYSRSIADHIRNGFFAIGFPNLQTMKPKLRAVYKEGVENDLKQINKVIAKASNQATIPLSQEQLQDQFSFSCQIL